MHDIFFDVQIDASKDAVFDAISNPAKLIKWWPLKCTGEPEFYAEYNYYFSDKYDWLAKVVEIKHSDRIYFKMTRADEDWTPTTFGYDLESINDATRLSFFHKNWPLNNHHYRRSAFCWALLLNGLKEYVESGKIIPFEERA